MEGFDPRPLCEQMVTLAKIFKREFTYKKEDIKELDEILEVLHNEYESGKMKEPELQKASLYAGVYTGELMLREKFAECGYRWALDENEPCLEKDDGNKCYPCAKVWKRIVNGREDSVKSFFDIGILIAEGKIPGVNKGK